MKKILYLVVISFLWSCTHEKNNIPQVYSGNALGTTFQLQFFYEKEIDLSNSIDSTFTALNESLSTYIPNSDITKINQGDSSIVVDQQFIDNFLASKEIFKITDGYFDPTVGLLVNAYGFGPEKYKLVMNPKTIDSLMVFVGLDKVILTQDNKIQKQYAQTYLDFNSIAKGYAVDRLSELLNQNQIKNYLIEVGGELVAKGQNLSKKEAWKIGIDKPSVSNGNERALLEFIVRLENRAMATSGNYRKFKTDSLGNKFVHTINPKTGLSEASDVLSATVFAANCMTADAYATAFMAMGFEKTYALLPKLVGIEVILIHSKGQEVHTFVSEGINEYVESLEEQS